MTQKKLFKVDALYMNVHRLFWNIFHTFRGRNKYALMILCYQESSTVNTDDWFLSNDILTQLIHDWLMFYHYLNEMHPLLWIG